MSSSSNWEDILKKIKELLPDTEGFECYPFRIGAYNAAVSSYFKLDYDDRTMAVLVLSTPKMFEGGFKKWLQSKQLPGESVEDVSEKVLDPLQNYMTETFNDVVREFPGESVEVIHDFDLTPTRRPKVLMCTCGHIAGAAFYVRPQIVSTVPDEIESKFPQKPEKPIIGVSLHPKFGGHFAFRAVFIFRGVKLPDTFVEQPPNNPLIGKTEMEELLILFNLHWRDGRFRDCGDPIEKYSNLQLEYFSKPPAQRWEVIKHWFQEI